MPEDVIKSDCNDIVLYVFNKVKGKNFREFGSLQNYIRSPDYPNGFIDAYILSNLLDFNLFILEKNLRQRKKLKTSYKNQ